MLYVCVHITVSWLIDAHSKRMFVIACLGQMGPFESSEFDTPVHEAESKEVEVGSDQNLNLTDLCAFKHSLYLCKSYGATIYS